MEKISFSELSNYKYDRDALFYVAKAVNNIVDELNRNSEPVELPKEQVKGNYQICEHINLKEWDSKIIEVLKNTKICPLCQPKEECKEEHCCMCHECENTRPMTPGEAEIAKGLDEAFPEPKEKSLRDASIRFEFSYIDDLDNKQVEEMLNSGWELKFITREVGVETRFYFIRKTTNL